MIIQNLDDLSHAGKVVQRFWDDIFEISADPAGDGFAESA